MIGKFVTFNSVTKPEISHTRKHSIYGEVVHVFQGRERKVAWVAGSPDIIFSTVLLVKLETFAKDTLVEIPVECVRVFDTLQQAKDSYQ